MTSVYCSLDDAKQELRSDNVLDTTEGRKIMRLIRDFSRRIDRTLGARRPLFVPYLEDRLVAIDAANTNSALRTLSLSTTQGGPSPLLDYTGAMVNGSAIAAHAYPTGLSPITTLQLTTCCASWYSSAYCNGSVGPQFTTISGIWGYHTDYLNAWLEVDTLAAGIDDTVKTITVTDIGGVNDLDETPRISPGNVLMIDDEWMDVVATDSDANTATVVRAVNGSAASSHAEDAPVSVFQWDENVRHATARQAALMYARQGAFNTARVSQYSNADFPEDVLQEVWNLLQPYANG